MIEGWNHDVRAVVLELVVFVKRFILLTEVDAPNPFHDRSISIVNCAGHAVLLEFLGVIESFSRRIHRIPFGRDLTGFAVLIVRAFTVDAQLISKFPGRGLELNNILGAIAVFTTQLAFVPTAESSRTAIVVVVFAFDWWIVL